MNYEKLFVGNFPHAEFIEFLKNGRKKKSSTRKSNALIIGESILGVELDGGASENSSNEGAVKENKEVQQS